MRTRSTLLALLLVAVCDTAAAAQVIEPPPRSTTARPSRTTGGIFGGRQRMDPNRMQQQFSFTLDALSGYEDNLSPDRENVPSTPGGPRRSGTTGTAAGVLQYQRMNTTQGIEASFRTVVATYQGVDVRPSVGGRANVRAFGRVFDRVGVNGWSEADYRPTFILNPALGAGPDAGLPPTDLTGGVTEVRSLNVSSGGNVSYDWTPRHHTGATYTHLRSRSKSLENTGLEGQTVTLSHRWDFARNFGMDGSYSLAQQTGDQPSGPGLSLDTVTGTIGFELRVPVSPSRRLTFTGQGGATQVRTFSSATNGPIEYVMPSGSGSARMDLGRTWSVSSDVSRTVTTLEGLTRQSFVTSTGTLWLGGNVGRRTRVSVNGSYSTGAPHRGDTGSFRSVGGTAQLQYELSRCCAAVTSYSYYEHRVLEVAAVPTGFPRTVDRNAVRVGLSFWVPLHGTFPADRRR